MPLEDLYSTLVSAGGMGILSAVLLWIYSNTSKRLDIQQDKHDHLLAEWKAERVETIESLIDEVAVLAGKVEGLATKIERMDGHVNEGLKEVREHYAVARGMAARDET
jgi:uncharacterized protein YlxW (UPF0749 family)